MVNAFKLIDLKAVLECIRHAKLDFIRKYLAKEKTWPLVNIGENASRCLKMARFLKAEPQSVPHQNKCGRFDMAEMDHITVLLNMKFDWLKNFIPYIKDSTICSAGPLW